jgi:uncharacterized membrane protein (UPF0127 family)
MIEAVPMGRPAIAVLAGMIVMGACSPPGSPGTALPEPRFDEATLIVQTESGAVRIRVEVADSPDERARGLMFREELPPDGGMVFLPEEITWGTFWMKDTLIPLSLAVWGQGGHIKSILDMEPCREDPCPSYNPQVPWIGAVEVNMGFFERHGVEVGDRVRLEQ